MGISKVKDLEVYSVAVEVAMEIFRLSLSFPMEEKYSLTDQIRRSSRSVAVNIAEGWGKRQYAKSFKRHLIDSMGSAEETKAWLEFAQKCEYINLNTYDSFILKMENIGAKLYRLHKTGKAKNQNEPPSYLLPPTSYLLPLTSYILPLTSYLLTTIRP